MEAAREQHLFLREKMNKVERGPQYLSRPGGVEKNSSQASSPSPEVSSFPSERSKLQNDVAREEAVLHTNELPAEISFPPLEKEESGNRLPNNLDRIFEEEREKLGLSDTPIKIVINEKIDYESYLKRFSSKIENLSFLETLRLSIKAIKELSNMAHQETSGIRQTCDSTYTFDVNPERMESEREFRSLCKHELYHVAAGHCDIEQPRLRDRVIGEITAMLYEYLNIRFHR